MVSARRACLRLDHVSSTVSTVASLCLSKQTPRHPIHNDPPMQLQGRVFFCHTNLPRCTFVSYLQSMSGQALFHPNVRNV